MVTKSRLESRMPHLVRQIEGLRPERQREVAVAAAMFSLALSGAPLASFDPSLMGQERRARRRELDAKALLLSDAASGYRDGHPEDHTGYLERFARAGAVRAAAFALDDDPLTAALEACYEVLTATQRGDAEGASALRTAIGGVAGADGRSSVPP